MSAPNAPDFVQEAIAAYSSRLNGVAPNAIWIQLAFMSAVGLVAVVMFSAIRPTNTVIYAPKIKYSRGDKRPPRLEKSFFGWVKPVVTAQEDEMFKRAGLDAVVFIRFLTMCRNMLVAIGILAGAVLIPVNVAYNIKYPDSRGKRTYIQKITIQFIRREWIWAHVTITYVVTAIIFYFLWVNYEHVVKLRWRWFRSEEYQNALNSRSLMITQVAKKSRSDQGLVQLLSSLQIPYPTSSVQIGRRVGALPHYIKLHNEAVRKLEEVLTTYFKNKSKVSEKRPTMRPKMFGPSVDAIDYLTERIKHFETKVEAARDQIAEKRAENFGFAAFESVPYAHIVAKRLHGKRKNGSYFDLAPVPSDIIWENIGLEDSHLAKNKFLGGILLIVFCALYTIPLLGVALLANIAALSSSVKFIEVWRDQYPIWMSAFVGIVPPLLAVVLQLVLPMIIRWISKGQGDKTHSQSDRRVTARYTAFLFITQFIIFSIVGVLITTIFQLVAQINGKKSFSAIMHTLSDFPAAVQSTWVTQSSYWLTILPLRGATAWFDLAQVVSLILVWVRAKLFGRTVREIREWTKPPEFDFPVYYSNHLLLLIVAFVYTPLSPLVPIFAIGSFAISLMVYKYQLMYVNVTRVETGGRLWRVVANRVLFAVMAMHLVMGLSVLVTRSWKHALALIPAIISVVIFKVMLKQKFDQRFDWFIPSDTETAELHLHHSDERKKRLEKRFGHPCLHEPLFTPMLHKDVVHLLPTVYNGRIGHGTADVDGKELAASKAGGLTFNILEEHDLAYDTSAYLRERDEDEMSVSTAKNFQRAGTTMTTNKDFLAQRDEYLNAALEPRGRDSTDSRPSEITRYNSSDNLIQYPPRYAAPPGRLIAGGEQGMGPHVTFGQHGGDGGATPPQLEHQRSYSSSSISQQVYGPGGYGRPQPHQMEHQRGYSGSSEHLVYGQPRYRGPQPHQMEHQRGYSGSSEHLVYGQPQYGGTPPQSRPGTRTDFRGESPIQYGSYGGPSQAQMGSLDPNGRSNTPDRGRMTHSPADSYGSQGQGYFNRPQDRRQ